MYPYGARGGTTEYFVSGQGPESAHILWTKPYYAGGVMDAMYGPIGYETAHYQGIGFDGLIIQGKLYYAYRGDGHVTEGYIVADLYTGETLQYVNDTMPSRGQLYNYESPNQHGGYPYMYKTSGVTLPSWATTESGKQTWEMLDAYTGRSVCKIANVSFGTMMFWFIIGAFPVYGKDGSWTNYNIQSQGGNYYLQIWNSTAIPTMLGDVYGTSAWQWRPSGGAFGSGWTSPPDGYWVHDGNKGWSLNVSLPASYVQGPRNSIVNQTAELRCVREAEYAIIGTQGQNNELGLVQGKLVKLSLERGKEGTKLSEITFTPPYASVTENVTSGMAFNSFGISGVYPEDGIFTFYSPKQLKRWGYSLETGELLWESEPEVQMSYYGSSSNYYEGKLYSYGYGGQLRCYNLTTGDVLWNYDATVEGLEIGYGGRYPIGVCAIADGKLYTVCGEHSPTQPLWRGQNLRCINATTGEDIWKILGFFGGMSPTESNTIMADGIVVGLNLFDSEVYAFGKGPSATTVTASPKVSVHGTNVLIEGSVTDQTETGRRNTNDIFEFSLKGTPAISDEDMSAWMEYMFMQQPKPADAKGVEVVISVLDPNNNCYEIGRTTSDINGKFGYAFEPLVPGTYQIIATFEGSAAYGPSSSSTYINVEEAPAATAEPTPPPASVADLYLVPGIVGIIVAIAVVGIVIMLMLRKR
jgi:outer membrane protein assembly factor BamB